MRAFPATPPIRRAAALGGGATPFDPDLANIQSRILDGGTIWTDAIASKYYLKDQSTDNTHLPRQGRCWLFDGVDDYGVAASRVTSGSPTAFTASCWIKTSTANRVVMSEAMNGAASLGFEIQTGSADATIISLYFGAAGCMCSSPTASISGAAWHHVAFVFDGGGANNAARLKCYIDGVAATVTFSGAVPANVASSTEAFQVGRFVNGSYFAGSLRDIRIYSSAKDSTAVAAIYNQSLTGNGAFDSTGLVAAYPCNEESGTTGYDISGNGNHLTLTNITQATFHATDTGVLTNRNNDEGYRLSSGVYIPKRLSDANAADGNALTVTGRAAYHGCAEVPCLTGGSTVYASVGTHSLTGDFELSFWCRYTGTTDSTHGPMFIGGGDFASGSSYQSYIWYRPVSNIIYWTCDGESHVITGGISNATLDDNQWHKLKVTRVGTTHTLLLDDVVLWTGTKSVVTMTIRQILQSFASQYYLVGNMADLRITYGGVTWYFPLQDGPGSSNTNRNLAYVKSDGTGGVISNAIVNGTVATIWGNRVPGQVKDWCIDNGGRIGAGGEYIAGLIGSANAADGNAKTLTAGKHGNPFSRINLDPATAAEFNGKNIQTSYEDVPCVTGNGSNVYVDLGSVLIPTTADFELSFWYYHSGTSRSWIINQWASGQAGRISILANSQTGVTDPGYVDFAIDSTTVTSASALLTANTWNYFTITRVGSSLTCTFTPAGGSLVTLTSITFAGSLYIGANTKFLDASFSLPNPSRISNFRITTGGVTTYFPLSDGSGADLAWYKSDGTKGVISSALQGTLTNVWSNKTDGSKVPAVKYSLRAIVTRESKFNRVASSGDDRFLTYESALSGSDLTNVETYVS